MQKLKYMK